MAISASDIHMLLSGGASNSDPALSLGGAVSSVAITDNVLHNLWDRVTAAEASAGDTEYRAFYIKNTSAETWMNVKLWIETNTPADDSIEIGIESSNGSPKQSIASEGEAPSGISFSAPSSKATGLSLGNIAAGEVRMIWMRRIVPAACASYSNNSYTLSMEGDAA